MQIRRPSLDHQFVLFPRADGAGFLVPIDLYSMSQLLDTGARYAVSDCGDIH